MPADNGDDADERGVTVEHLKQAADWYATLGDAAVSDQERAAWRAWLAGSPPTAGRGNTSRRSAASSCHCGRPAPAAPRPAGVAAARRSLATRRRVVNGLAGILGLGAATWLGWRHTPLPALVAALRADYATGTGERRELRLADGSRVWLNTGTALQVRYQDNMRSLALLAGEILIETAPDAQGRPFFVQTRFGRLQALGTRFTVRLTDQQTRLDVFDGAVEILTQYGGQRRIEAGGAARFDDRALTPLDGADDMRAAWSKGILLADNMPLGDLLAELSRYRRGHINVAPAVAGLKVMGVYPTDDTDQALAMLAQTLPIRIHHSLPWWITVDAR
ncbi:FecR domain-containing protein [Achromobacter insuavis]